MDRPRILLTGFGPFPGIAINVSAQLIEAIALDPRAKNLNAEIITAVLPTEWQRGLREARALLADAKPDIALHFGVSPFARGFVIELQALNACAALPDACGKLPEAPNIEAGGQASRQANIPAGEIQTALRLSRVPVRLSQDAGTYLCNAVLYQSLRVMTAPAMAGFIHLPQVLGWKDRMDEEQAIRGGLAIMETCLRNLPSATRQGLLKD